MRIELEMVAGTQEEIGMCMATWSVAGAGANNFEMLH